MTSCVAAGRQAQGITPATHEHIYRSDILRQPRPATVAHRNGRAEAEATCRIGVVLPLEADADGRPSWEVVVRSFATKGLIALPEGLSVDSVLR